MKEAVDVECRKNDGCMVEQCILISPLGCIDIISRDVNYCYLPLSKGKQQTLVVVVPMFMIFRTMKLEIPSLCC